MNKSELINEIAKALSDFQAEQNPVAPNKENKFLGNKYADLTSLIEASKENLRKCGLSVSQVLTGDGVFTILMHSSGQWIGDTFKIEPTDSKGTNAAQEMGIAITYARRYAYASILGLVTDEDTDGADKSNPKGEKPKITNWLTQENLSKMLAMSKAEVLPLYDKYITPPNGMKAEYRKQLKDKFKL